MSTQTSEYKRITTKVILNMKESGEKVAVLTAYDYATAKLLDESGIDIILVGDSLGNVFQGLETTLPVTLDEIIYHTKVVRRAVKRAMLVADMPFMSFQVNTEEAVRNCGRVLKESGAEAVKMEGGQRIEPLVRQLVDIGIPVMGHLGLTPQSIYKFGTYEVRAKETKEAKQLLEDAKTLDKVGVFAIVLEKIPTSLAAKVTKSVSCATIGIGAGPSCDGQVLVINDMLGMNEQFHPRFVRSYAKLADSMRGAFKEYISDVKAKKFPSKEESY
ncbi:MAG TPA: 3-methyl-2-oxobutanoate hydroxymethyltransferase [Bacteroidota bacterium]|nr:3-methyl-2-oxobutanoate hydroxymethyltransferase [Bacteroidota bacterium]